jgi:hypothetical protein
MDHWQSLMQQEVKQAKGDIDDFNALMHKRTRAAKTALS